MKRSNKPKMGRPPIDPDKKVETKRFSVVMPDKLEKRIQSGADSSGRSRNAEIVERLEQTFTRSSFVGGYGDPDTGSISQIIERLIYFSQLSSGGILWDDPEAHAELKADICAVLDTFGPSPGIPGPGKGASPRARGHLTQIYQMMQHGRQGDESADAYAVEEITERFSKKMADRLEPKK